MKRLVVENTIEERCVFIIVQKTFVIEGGHSMLKLQDVKMGGFACPDIQLPD